MRLLVLPSSIISNLRFAFNEIACGDMIKGGQGDEQP